MNRLAIIACIAFGVAVLGVWTVAFLLKGALEKWAKDIRKKDCEP